MVLKKLKTKNPIKKFSSAIKNFSNKIYLEEDSFESELSQAKLFLKHNPIASSFAKQTLESLEVGGLKLFNRFSALFATSLYKNNMGIKGFNPNIVLNYFKKLGSFFKKDHSKILDYVDKLHTAILKNKGLSLEGLLSLHLIHLNSSKAVNEKWDSIFSQLDKLSSLDSEQDNNL